MHGGECLLGEVVDGAMRLSEWGQVVSHYWERIPVHVPHVELDEWEVMPNHVHGIIVIAGPATGLAGRHRRELEIGDDPPCQSFARDARHPVLAALLLDRGQ